MQEITKVVTEMYNSEQIGKKCMNYLCNLNLELLSSTFYQKFINQLDLNQEDQSFRQTVTQWTEYLNL